MKRSLFIPFMIMVYLSVNSQENKTKSDYTYSNVPFNKVTFTDNFWTKRIETSRNVTIPYSFKKCEETGRLNNFAIASGLMEGKFATPFPFDDSDVFKIMEGAAYLLSVKKDPTLDAYLDSLIYLISKAQEPDGYLYTNRTISNPLHPWAGKSRWENVRDNSHELYNVGHMYEAAIAHFQATGKRSFLEIAIKNANLLCATFGPEPEKITVAPGHQEIELALVKLYRVTGDNRYLDLSKFFLDARGKYDKYDKTSADQFRNGAYWQNHLPVVEQTEAVGHAVRAPYMYAAMADIAALKQDPAYLIAIDKLWNNVVSKKIYITGGIGSTQHGEAFGKDYELPNATAYCETCASIANCMWNHRMFMLHGDSKYIDVLERSLYNGVLSGIDLSGNKFFYSNVLSCDRHGSERSEWFDCSCCPSNLSRFIPSVPGYVYAVSYKGLYVNLFGTNHADIQLNEGNEIHITQASNYPWNGDVKITLEPNKTEEFDVFVRIPGWAVNKPLASDLYHYLDKTIIPTKISVNGKEIQYSIENGYAVLSQNWKKGDVIHIVFPMEVQKVISNEKVTTNRDLVSVERGPLVYCAEFSDNGGLISDCVFNPNQKLKVEIRPDLFDGVNVLKAGVKRIKLTKNLKKIKSITDTLTFIPYYGRSHRGNGEMEVWLPTSDSMIVYQLKELARMVDKVVIGEEESEKAHKLAGENTNSGGSVGLNSWRDARNGGWFSYEVQVDPKKQVELVLTYFSEDGGNREFEILIDNIKIAEQKLRAETYSKMIERNYPIPLELTKGKKTVIVMMKAFKEMIAGGIFGLRIQKINN